VTQRTTRDDKDSRTQRRPLSRQQRS